MPDPSEDRQHPAVPLPSGPSPEGRRPVSGQPQTTPRRLLRGLLTAILAAVLVFSLLALANDLDELKLSLRSLNPWSFAGALALASGNYGLRFFRWQRYLRILDLPRSPRISALIFLSGFAMSVTPGKVGELFKSVLLQRHYGTPIERSGPIVIAERLTDVFGLVLLIALGAFVFPEGGWLAFLGLLLVAAALAACAIPALGHTVLAVLSKVPWLGQLAPKLRVAYDTLRDLMRPGPLVEATALSVVAWFLEVLALHVLLWGIGIDLSLLISTFVYASSTMAGALAMMPGGLLVTEAGMTGLLVSLGNDAVSTADASAVTILVRLATLWWAVGIGFFSLLLFRRTRHRIDSGEQ